MIRYVVVTHAHADHASGANEFARRSDATVLGPGPGEGFRPDGLLGDGDVVAVDGWRFEALATPGHCAEHLCYLLDAEVARDADPRPIPERLLFSGDHVLGGMSSVVVAPGGDMTDHLASLERVLGLDPVVRRLAPGHGAMADDAPYAVEAQLAHRRAREQQVLSELAGLGSVTVDELARAVYPGLEPDLVAAASLQTWAHLRRLAELGRVVASDPDDRLATWACC